ncbi:MAG: hypothetical protein JXR68_13010 [Bacteroidales bacterium]|nr:hypothetical protein [Bacteroidales bacterium]
MKKIFMILAFIIPLMFLTLAESPPQMGYDFVIQKPDVQKTSIQTVQISNDYVLTVQTSAFMPKIILIHPEKTKMLKENSYNNDFRTVYLAPSNNFCYNNSVTIRKTLHNTYNSYKRVKTNSNGGKGRLYR